MWLPIKPWYITHILLVSSFKCTFIIVIGLSRVQFSLQSCNWWQNQTTKRQESNLLTMGMITDAIGWHKVLSLINHNHYNVKKITSSTNISNGDNVLDKLFLQFGKSPFFSKICGFCYGYWDQFCDWWIWLRGHSMICCFNYLIAGVWLQPTVQSHCLITTVQND